MLIIHEDRLDGSQKSILTLAKYIYKKYNIYVLSPSKINLTNIFPETENVNFISYKNLYNIYSPNKYKNIYYLIPSLLHICKLIIRNNIDIVYVNTISQIYVGLLKFFVKSTFILHLREVVTGNKKQVVKILGYSLFDKCIFNSVTDRTYYKIPNKSYQVYNIVEPFIVPNINIQENYQKFCIGYVGQITPNKNLEIILMALKEMNSKFHLKVYGRVSDEHYYSRIQKIIFDHKLNNITFYGHCNTIEDIYKEFDLLITPSFSETFNRVMIEAAMCGKVVIASKIDIHKEMFGYGISGEMINDLINPKELKQTIVKIHKYFELYKQKTKNFRKQEFYPDKIIKKYMDEILL